MAQLLPHSGDAILLDTVDAFDDETLSATAIVKPGGPYSQADGSLPPWLGLEIMAQAVGAWAGCQAQRTGRQVGLGFLLGTRRYDCHVREFAAGTRLSVHVARSLQDDSGMGIFECRLHAGQVLAAEARLNVYRPPDAGVFIQEPIPSSDGQSA
jgi:predicted hotdog family 3-hydroxylacyl-ACP dehydratase